MQETQKPLLFFFFFLSFDKNKLSLINQTEKTKAKKIVIQSKHPQYDGQDWT